MDSTPSTLPLSGTQKLAALLVILGSEGAARVMQRLDEREIEAVSAEVAKLQVISQQLQQQILREFGDIVASSASMVRGGSDFAEALLQKSVGAPKASAILNRVAPVRRPSPAVQRLAELEPAQIAGALKHERPQAAALVASCLEPRKAAQVLALFNPEFREQVIERIATLGPTPVETIERVVGVLLQRAGSQQRQVLTQTGGLKTAATLLNGMSKKVSQSVLASLEERNPDLGQAIRQKMFTFDDLTRLDASSLQRVLREVDLRDLALALKPASEAFKNALLSCISRRAAETVKEEMSYLGAVRMREVEAARLRIVGILRGLEAEGLVDLDDSAEETLAEAAAA